MEYSEPMKKVWMSNGLVQVVNKDDRLPLLGAKSSRADWEKQGRNLFERRQYEHSMLCFAKSGNQDAMALAEAYVLREKARRLASRSDNRNTVNAAFMKAASAFEKCQRPRRAAECYQVCNNILCVTRLVYKQLGLLKCSMYVGHWNVSRGWGMFQASKDV